MKKIFSTLFIGIIFLSGVGASEYEPEKNHTHDIFDQHLTTPIMTDIGEYLLMELSEAESYLLVEGKPILPQIQHTYHYPPSTIIHEIHVDIEYTTYQLSKKILPTPVPIPSASGGSTTHKFHQDERVYENLNPYPVEPHIISHTAGLHQGTRCRTLSIHVFPRYYPVEDKIEIPQQLHIQVSYNLPKNTPRGNDYDLLIITDEKFVAALDPLVDHKEAMGIATKVETTQHIYNTYDGRDAPEDIKLCIKEAIEDYGITYVLLAGGRKGQTLQWYIPERLTNNDDGWESGFASDLYYADIYKLEENHTVFEDWDSNGNNIFAEWSSFVNQRDVIDYDPDVYIGRLPFRYLAEIKPVVNKIITYETTADDSWFKTGFAIGGDTGPPCRGPATPGIYEGEIATNMSATLLESVGFTIQRLYLSEGAWTGRNDIIQSISQGCGFIDMAGHGNPAYWGNFLPDAQSEEEMVDGLLLRDIPKLRNQEKLPFIVVGGCHNAQFNVTMMNLLLGIWKYGINGMFLEPPFRFFYNEWVPRCFCTALVFARRGGAIGSIGCSGLGLGYFNIIGLSDWLNIRFFDAYANQSQHHAGAAHGQALSDYISIVGGVNTHQNDRKTIEEWTLIGDPSLLLGGYQ